MSLFKCVPWKCSRVAHTSTIVRYQLNTKLCRCPHEGHHIASYSCRCVNVMYQRARASHIIRRISGTLVTQHDEMETLHNFATYHRMTCYDTHHDMHILFGRWGIKPQPGKHLPCLSQSPREQRATIRIQMERGDGRRPV